MLTTHQTVTLADEQIPYGQHQGYGNQLVEPLDEA